MSKRLNGEGSIYRNGNRGYAAYVWIDLPNGERDRKYVYGQTTDIVQEKWNKLKQQAARGPMAARVPTVESYAAGWLEDVIKPDLVHKTYENYELFTRLYIVPYIGKKRLDKLTLRDVQKWFNDHKTRCQCCAQGKDARRAETGKARCCAKGECCEQIASEWTRHQAWTVLLSMLSSAVRDDLVTRNVASLLKVPVPRKSKDPVWEVEESRQFLESAEDDRDQWYAAYVLLLLFALRKGELLGLGWDEVELDEDSDTGTASLEWQIKRENGRLVRRRLKTAASEAPLPLPAPVVRALRGQKLLQEQWKLKAGDAWEDSGLVITTRLGGPVDPRNFHRAFKARIKKAGVRETTVHATRKACASLLVALEVHPRITMAILRHSKISTTMEIYAKATNKKTLEALQRLGEQFERGPEAS
ncbi:putative phage integrase [Nocardioidaceae bacterium Broad-1]|nr:putative phage integrase [Nocardioidaceae bacterium Broad-1]